MHSYLNLFFKNIKIKKSLLRIIDKIRQLFHIPSKAIAADITLFGNAGIKVKSGLNWFKICVNINEIQSTQLCSKLQSSLQGIAKLDIS